MEKKIPGLSLPTRLSREVDRLFDELIYRPWGFGRAAKGDEWSPQLDLYETDDAISRIETVRDLLREVSAAEQVTGQGIDPQRGSLSNLAFAAAALQRGNSLVWFPEGARSRTGTLQRFRPGIGLILQVRQVPVVPTWIIGSADALSIGQWLEDEYAPTARCLLRSKNPTSISGGPTPTASEQ